MAPLDIEALLEQNPGVDREALKKHLEEMSKITVQKRPQRGNTSPYSGRRLTPDGRGRWTAGNQNFRRPHYRAI
jgi:hypothetical protein